MKKLIIMLLCGLSFSFGQDYLGDEDDVRYTVFGGINMNGGVDSILGYSVDSINEITFGARYYIDEKQDVTLQMAQYGGESDLLGGKFAFTGFDASYNYTFFDNLTLAGYVGGVYSMMTDIDTEWGTIEDVKESNAYGVQAGLHWFMGDTFTLTAQYKQMLTEFDWTSGNANSISILVGYNF
jgi:hypothetical protein